MWGGGALAPTTAFDELDKLIFCKIWDEKWRDNAPKTKGEPFAFQIISYPEDKDDKQNLKAKTELEKRIRELYEYGRKKDPEVFKDDIKLDKHKIYTVVQYLQDINLSKTDLDAKVFRRCWASAGKTPTSLCSRIRFVLRVWGVTIKSRNSAL